MRDDYEALYSQFRWQVPERFNIAQACCTRWADDARRTALIVDHGDGRIERIAYRSLQRDGNRLANALRALGAQRGDRVAIVLPQRPETVVSHVAIHSLGAIAMPLSMLFGPEALRYRLENSEASIAIVAATQADALRAARGDALRHLIVVDDGCAPARGDAASTLGGGEHAWSSLLASASDRFEAVGTNADDPAVLIYTSGTTGPPKGALIAHRTLIGNLTGFVASQNWFPHARDVFWSPADWAWTGGLMDALLPTLYFGRPIVAHSGRFDPTRAYEMLERHGVTNAFLFPTALKMLMKHDPEPRKRHRLALRAIMSGGEAVGDTLFDWCRDALGVTVNEIFGQTEANYVVGNSAQRWPARPGSIGRPYPGHRIAILDDDGNELPPGQLGEIAVGRHDIHGDPDPVVFLGYWRNDEATRGKFTGNWLRTGDLAAADPDGYLWYGGRADDMFKAAGYRIGPSEIESCLIRHPAVANAAVVPKPDVERGNLVKAYVVLASGQHACDELVEALQLHVRGKLAPYEYPKEIEFVEELPMTTTGKVQRAVLRKQEQARAEALRTSR
ncbi:MAG: AMP-binding protein [Burkholderiaceae bacterium]|nr:AMP-binding protein [Burkholderiaceae bacterium]